MSDGPEDAGLPEDPRCELGTPVVVLRELHQGVKVAHWAVEQRKDADGPSGEESVVECRRNAVQQGLRRQHAPYLLPHSHKPFRPPTAGLACLWEDT